MYAPADESPFASINTLAEFKLLVTLAIPIILKIKFSSTTLFPYFVLNMNDPTPPGF